MLHKQTPNIAGIILTGGKSSRMGTDKAHLPWQGGRLVDYVANILKETHIEKLYVSGHIAGYRSIIDALPNKGPVGGICSTLHHLKNRFSHLIFVPVDLPFLSAACVNIVLSMNENEVQYIEGHPLPFCLQVTPHTLHHAQLIYQSLQNGRDISVKQYLSGLKERVLPISTDCEKALRNTNTPEQWQEVHNEHSHE